MSGAGLFGMVKHTNTDLPLTLLFEFLPSDTVSPSESRNRKQIFNDGTLQTRIYHCLWHRGYRCDLYKTGLLKILCVFFYPKHSCFRPRSWTCSNRCRVLCCGFLLLAPEDDDVVVVVVTE